MNFVSLKEIGLSLFLVIHLSYDLRSQDRDSLKCWCKNDKLKWNDFKGRIPDAGERSYLKAASSLELIPVRTRKNNLVSYNIKLVFRKYESWTTDTAKYLLSHEQLHFDISELYARKLRKALQEVSDTNRNPKQEIFSAVIQKLYVEIANRQAKYDEETIHGIDDKSQFEWEKKISLELRELEKYSSTHADCQLP